MRAAILNSLRPAMHGPQDDDAAAPEEPLLVALSPSLPAAKTGRKAGLLHEYMSTWAARKS